MFHSEGFRPTSGLSEFLIRFYSRCVSLLFSFFCPGLEISLVLDQDASEVLASWSLDLKLLPHCFLIVACCLSDAFLQWLFELFLMGCFIDMLILNVVGPWLTATKSERVPSGPHSRLFALKGVKPGFVWLLSKVRMPHNQPAMIGPKLFLVGPKVIRVSACRQAMQDETAAVFGTGLRCVICLPLRRAVLISRAYPIDANFLRTCFGRVRPASNS